MGRTITIMLGAVLVAAAAASGFAQTALERLETQIRGRIASSGRETAGISGPLRTSQAAPHDAGGQGYLGLMADDGKDRGRGVRVLNVQPGGPAERAGLRSQDLITAIDTVRVRQISDMSELLGTLRAGQSVDFDVIRDGKPQKLHVVLGQRPNSAERPTSSPRVESPETIPLGEPIPEPPLAQLTEPTLAPPKGPEPVISTSTRLDQLEKRLEGLERRVGELEKALKKRNKD